MDDVQKQYLVRVSLDIYIEAYDEKDVKSKIKPLKKYLQSHKNLDIDVNEIEVEEY